MRAKMFAEPFKLNDLGGGNGNIGLVGHQCRSHCVQRADSPFFSFITIIPSSPRHADFDFLQQTLDRLFGGWLIFYAASVPLVKHDSSRPTDYKRKKYPRLHNLK